MKRKKLEWNKIKPPIWKRLFPAIWIVYRLVAVRNTTQGNIFDVFTGHSVLLLFHSIWYFLLFFLLKKSAAFRLCTLWFDNFGNAQINDAIKSALSSVPARHFLPLIYQIASRLGSCSQFSDFQSVLGDLIVKVASQYPQHTMYQLFALKYEII